MSLGRGRSTLAMCCGLRDSATTILTETSSENDNDEITIGILLHYIITLFFCTKTS